MSEFSDKIEAGEACKASFNIREFLPDSWEDKSKEYRHGFCEAIITLLFKGKITPTEELN